MGSVALCFSIFLTCFAILTPKSTSSTLQQIFFEGIVAKQSTDRFGLTLREVWTGDTYLQQVYSGDTDEVLACEETPAPGLEVYPGLNSTLILPKEFTWLNITSLRRDCRRAERVLSRAKRSTERRRTRHGHKKKKKKHKLRKGRRDHLAKGKKGRWSEHMITPGTKWCGPNNMASRYTDLGPSWEADRCCRTHDRCQKFIRGLSRGYNTLNVNPFTLSHCTCDMRQSELLRFPGTMWCGRGYSATSYRQLGPFSAADRCCRRHDTACPDYIPAMSYRFGLFNWRPSTLMHCHCDGRFRTCLKMADTTASRFVGKLFFNMVQTRCFVLKTERICVERNWRGKCLKTELRRLAHLRSNMGF